MDVGHRNSTSSPPEEGFACQNPSEASGIGVFSGVSYIFGNRVSRCEFSWFLTNSTNLCFLSATQYSYNSESPYFGKHSERERRGWLIGWIGQFGLGGCMIDEWHFCRESDD